jgi:hypothetical protein
MLLSKDFWHSQDSVFLKDFPTRADGVARVVEGLPSKLEALSLNPSATK